MIDDDKTNIASAEAQDYNNLGANDDIVFCKKYNTSCHIIGALIIAGLVVLLATLGMLYFG